MSIQRASMVCVPFRNKPFGHVSILFTRTDGEHVAISPEAEVPAGDFSLIRGLKRSYRLRYTVEPKEAHFGRYRKAGRTPLEYTLPLTPSQLDALYAAMLARSSALEERHEWYHSLFNSCVTNVIHHLALVRTPPRTLLTKACVALAPVRLPYTNGA